MARNLDRIAVLGSNSFSGSSFVAHMLGQGAEILGISRSPEPPDAFLPYRRSAGAGQFRFASLDLNNDLIEMVEVLRTFRPSCVVNFAAQSMVAESWDNPDHWFNTNVVATVRLHDALRGFDFLDSYVHVTTPEVYGSTGGVVREDSAFNPSTPYAVSRAAADMSLRTYHERYGFPVLYTRAANIYGEGQQLYRVVPRTILSIRSGQKLQLHGGGASERSFIHADDVSEATRLIAASGRLGESYHISTDRTVTIRSLVETICADLGARFEDHVEVVGDRPGKDAAYRLDSTKLRTELGWSDKVSLEQGLERVASWVDQFLPELFRMPWTYMHKP